MRLNKKYIFLKKFFFGLALTFLMMLSVQPVHAEKCGKGNKAVEIAIPVGCKGEQAASDNPIYDMLGGIVRFLSAGVGIVIVLMIVISGIQYITSSGNPEGLQAAKKRLANAVIGLLLFIFMAAILNFLIPGGLL